MASLLRVTNKVTDLTTYYVDGKKVTVAAYRAIRAASDLDCLRTEDSGQVVRHYAEARPRKH